METMRRWQEWGNVILAGMLFIGVLVYVVAGVSQAEFAFIVMGVLLFAIGTFLLADPATMLGEWSEMFYGIVIVVSPWVFDFATLTPFNDVAWALGALMMLFAGWMLLTISHPTTR